MYVANQPINPSDNETIFLRTCASTGPISSIFLRASLGLLLVAGFGCSTTSKVSGSTADGTRPSLRATSIHLLPEFGSAADIGRSHPANPGMIERVVTFPLHAGFEGRTQNDEALITALAEDQESGIRSVAISGRLTAWCQASWQATSPPTQQTKALDLVSASSPQSSDSLPTTRSVSLAIKHSDERALCSGEVVADYEYQIEVTANNGANLSSAVQLRIVRPVSVIIHNMWSYCLNDLEWRGNNDLHGTLLCDELHQQQPGTGPGKLSHLDEQLFRWGDYFATQDIVLLNEAPRRHWLDKMASRMPDHAFIHDGTVAIFSRWPISNREYRSSLPVVVTEGNTTVSTFSEYVRGNVQTPRGTLDTIATHWQHRPAPVTSHPSRVGFAQAIATATLGSKWAMVGGDFNSKSVWIASPDELITGDAQETAEMQAKHQSLGGHSMPEIQQMENAFILARREVREHNSTNWKHEGLWPVDYLFLRYDVNAVLYTNVTGVYGSDHPTQRLVLIRR